jgi:hypothetical protein
MIGLAEQKQGRESTVYFKPGTGEEMGNLSAQVKNDA